MHARSTIARSLAAAACIAVLIASTGCSVLRSAAGGGSEGATPAAPPAAAGVPSPGGEWAQDNSGGSTGSLSQQKQRDAVQGKTAVVSADRMVIRNANMRLEVKKVGEAVTALRKLTARHGAVISNLQLASDDGPVTPYPAAEDSSRSDVLPTGLPFSGSVTVRVPVAKFDAFRDEAERLGRVLSEGSDDEDVTQQHVDLKARLENARAEEARLRTFFDKARSVSDMLSIERELGRVRGEIESMTAQLASLERQAAMATLTIELVEPKAIVRPSNGIDWGFAEALTTGIQGMVDLTKGILVIVIALAPVWVAALALFFLVRWRLRARRSRQAAASAAAAEE